jgi:hypothetical protein
VWLTKSQDAEALSPGHTGRRRACRLYALGIAFPLPLLGRGDEVIE